MAQELARSGYGKWFTLLQMFACWSMLRFRICYMVKIMLKQHTLWHLLVQDGWIHLNPNLFAAITLFEGVEPNLGPHKIKRWFLDPIIFSLVGPIISSFAPHPGPAGPFQHWRQESIAARALRNEPSQPVGMNPAPWQLVAYNFDNDDIWA